MTSSTGPRQGNRANSRGEARPPAVASSCPVAEAFTLIEVLITLVILSTSLVLVLRAFGSAAAALGESRDSLWAGLLMKEKVAEVAMAAEDGSGAGLQSSSGRIAGGGVDFLWTRRVRTLEDLPAQTGVRKDPVMLNEILVTVRREGSTRERSVTTRVITGRPRRGDPTE